jgi:NADPH:quinone reductase-like Zn-dependent oxidoreductase
VCVDAQYPHPPGREEVTIDMIYMPLNPSDLMMTAGIYGAAVPPLPYAMGREGVGRIVETGPGVSKFSIGDLVIAITAPT